MRVLLLGPSRPPIESSLRSLGDEVRGTEEPLSTRQSVLDGIDFLVSYGYRYLIPAEVLRSFGECAVNLHISLLPWNRGADPNLWSYLQDTPKGVTIHVLDAGLDTGPILVQQAAVSVQGDTLRSSHERLSVAVENLFCSAWPDIRRGALAPIPQAGPGTAHRSVDRTAYEHLLTEGWDTPVVQLQGKAVG